MRTRRAARSASSRRAELLLRRRNAPKRQTVADKNVRATRSAAFPLVVAIALMVLTPATQAEVIFKDDFETLHERWTKNINGGGTIEIVPGGVEGKCLKITTDGGVAYLTTQLDPQEYAGTTVEVIGMVKLEDVKIGPQVYSTAKFHIATTVGPQKTVRNYADRWLGTSDWTEKKLVAELDENLGRITLDLGIQNGSGTVYFDDLVVRDTYGAGRPISLFPVANLGRSDGVPGDGKGSFLDLGLHDLFSLPEGSLENDGATFYVPPDGSNAGKTCVILKGEKRPDLPSETESLPVNKQVASLHFLQAAAWADVDAKEPCLTYEIEYADGEKVTVEMKAGVDVANFDDPREFDNCKIVWQGRNGAGKQVGVGTSTWENPRPDVAVKSVTVRSAGNGVPIVLAVTYLKARP